MQISVEIANAGPEGQAVAEGKFNTRALIDPHIHKAPIGAGIDHQAIAVVFAIMTQTSPINAGTDGVKQPHRGMRSDTEKAAEEKVSRPQTRSEERRVGKECRSRWAREHERKQNR